MPGPARGKKKKNQHFFLRNGQVGCVQFENRNYSHDAMLRQSQTKQNTVIFLNKTADDKLGSPALLPEDTLKADFIFRRVEMIKKWI